MIPIRSWLAIAVTVLLSALVVDAAWLEGTATHYGPFPQNPLWSEPGYQPGDVGVGCSDGQPGGDPRWNKVLRAGLRANPSLPINQFTIYPVQYTVAVSEKIYGDKARYCFQTIQIRRGGRRINATIVDFCPIGSCLWPESQLATNVDIYGGAAWEALGGGPLDSSVAVEILWPPNTGVLPQPPPPTPPAPATQPPDVPPSNPPPAGPAICGNGKQGSCGSDPTVCCSPFGYCGRGPSYCVNQTSPPPAPPPPPASTAGSRLPGTCLSDVDCDQSRGFCCSKFYFCGRGADYCGSKPASNSAKVLVAQAQHQSSNSQLQSCAGGKPDQQYACKPNSSWSCDLSRCVCDKGFAYNRQLRQCVSGDPLRQA
ncbi:uncharacterized protein BJ171DRAFT_600774 [Polychytrium aggregatum]|uniref:uncharacterized protein n=1 Tax=Polychytrium aggregatum TaxID=110093 RepID=UPI0022FF257B|nr:uncharacterized protein BJ171DRAFT_600774 [Polychytrium aggregatum]KAI9202778.1 hypothetical protein BJ171DRAFT_600774 [Polychytrium aggregatum]